MAKRRRHPHMQRRRKNEPRLEDILGEAQALQNQGREREALEVLEDAPQHLRGHPAIHIMRASTYVSLGLVEKGMEILEQLERDHAPTSDPPLPYLLAQLYAELGWPAHALRAARRGLQQRHQLPEEVKEGLEEIVQYTQSAIEKAAAEQDKDVHRTENLLYYAEEAAKYAGQGKYLEGAEVLVEVMREMPDEADPRANRAMLLFMGGEVEEAHRVSQEVLASYPDNLYALATMIHIHMARGEEQQAQPYVERLKALPIHNEILLNRLIEMLGLANDDEGILELYRRGRRYGRDLEPLSLITLGSAAANLGDRNEAQKFWRRAQVELEGFPILNLFQEALRAGKPGPGIALRYPTYQLNQMIAAERFQPFMVEMDAVREREDALDRLSGVVGKFVERNPHAVRAFADLMWQMEEPQMGLELLMFAGTPRAIQELERLAFSQAGPLELRFKALSALSMLGALDQTTPVEVWNEETGRWEEAQFAAWEFSTEVERPVSPALHRLLEEGLYAMREDRLDVARRKFEEALALDARIPMAYHNLAVILKRKGQPEAAVEHLERALEIDPQYVYARCTLARYYLFDWEDVETAKEILAPIQEKSPLTPVDFLYYQRTLADVAIEEEDYKLARRHAETMLELDPQNEIAHELLEYLDEVEEYENSFWAELIARRRRLAERKLERSVRPDATLAESLDRLTKNALVGTARAMPVPRTYTVRKTELIEDLAQFLATPSWLERIVEGLSEEERQALRDVLNAGGTLPWEEFTARYGHDLDESPDWNYHEPKTVMGRLRMLGLLSRGRLGEEYILLVPNELRPLLPPLLGMERA